MKASARESLVIDLLLQGASNAEIAKELSIPLRTVKHHFARLFIRYGLAKSPKAKRVQLAVMLYRERNNERGPSQAGS